jgi:Na+/alanine symporter
VANKEQLVSFVAITIITIVLMSLLAYSTVLGAEGENNISFLEAEGNALMDKVGTWFGYLFWFIGATSLFAAALGIVDYTSGWSPTCSRSAACATTTPGPRAASTSCWSGCWSSGARSSC